MMAGANVASVSDKMVKIGIDQLYRSLVNPKQHIEATVRQLRILSTINPTLYKTQKRLLPYFVCGTFNPPYRRTENFAYTEYFVIDIDKLSSKTLSLEDTKRLLAADERLMLCFASPGGDGLKLVFRLAERCYDSGLYSIFYKAFAQQFSHQYRLEQVVDGSTSDVARACFISVDHDAYYNPTAQPIDMKAFVDTDNPLALFDTKAENERNEKLAAQQNAVPRNPEPDKQTMDRIKQVLNDAKKNKREAPPAYVPQELNEIIEGLKAFIAETGLVVTAIDNIQYAKKIKVSMGIKKAEANLFYGKRGFSVVVSPRVGTDPTLNHTLAELIQAYVDTL